MTQEPPRLVAESLPDPEVWRQAPLHPIQPTVPVPGEEPVRRRLGPLQSAARHPWLVVLPIILLLVPGLAWALMRTPNYTAQATILVGDVSVSAQSVPGYVAASQDLAGTYARLVDSSVVAGPVASALGLDPKVVSAALSASAVPQSSIIVIDAKSKSQDTSVKLAASAVENLVSQVTSQQATSGAAASLLEQYNTASASEGQLRLQLQLLNQSAAQLAKSSPGSAALESVQLQVIQKQAAVNAAALTTQALADQYRQALSSASSTVKLKVIGDATSQGSDRLAKIELAVVAALLLGGVIGLALATWASNRRA